MNSILESLFIPESSLQGSEFPVHLTWQLDKEIIVTIEVPTYALTVKAIHNVAKRSLKAAENKIRISNFEKNGYLGLVFKTKVIKEKFLHVPLKIGVETKTGLKQSINGDVLLFRQDLVLHVTPEIIDVKQAIGQVKIANKIQLRNEGKGTSIVRFKLNEGSDGEIRKPPEIAKFSSKFCSVLIDKYEQVGTDFPRYCKITNDFSRLLVDFVQGTYSLNKRYMLNIEATYEAIESATLENEEYLKRLLEGLYSAYLASVSLITEVHGLLGYLKSLAKNKIILQTATSVIDLKPGKNKISGLLEIIDLAENVFDPLQIETTISVLHDSNVSIPLYSIFDWME